MAFPELVDIRVAMETANLYMTEEQKDLIDDHWEAFLEKSAGMNPGSQEAQDIYDQLLDEFKGSAKVYALQDALIDFNLKRVKENISL